MSILSLDPLLFHLIALCLRGSVLLKDVLLKVSRRIAQEFLYHTSCLVDFFLFGKHKIHLCIAQVRPEAGRTKGPSKHRTGITCVGPSYISVGGVPRF